MAIRTSPLNETAHRRIYTLYMRVSAIYQASIYLSHWTQNDSLVVVLGDSIHRRKSMQMPRYSNGRHPETPPSVASSPSRSSTDLH